MDDDALSLDKGIEELFEYSRERMAGFHVQSFLAGATAASRVLLRQEIAAAGGRGSAECLRRHATLLQEMAEIGAVVLEKTDVPVRVALSMRQALGVLDQLEQGDRDG